MLVLSLLCIALGIASFASGWLGVVLPLGADSLRVVNSGGTGMLIGSALAVVIPEGIELVVTADGRTDGTKGDRFVGLVCVLGFLLMAMLDATLDRWQRSRMPKSQYVSIEALHEIGARQRDTDPAGSAPSSQVDHAGAVSTTTGLVIHSLADGVALGAAFNASFRVSAVVFVAMLVHKFPAAFGLASVLLRCSLSRRQLRLHLAAFAAAAPLGAIITNMAVAGAVGGTPGNLELSTGLLVVFSGGTFLYVAVSHMATLSLDRLSDLGSFVGGALFPVALQLLAHHDHS